MIVSEVSESELRIAKAYLEVKLLKEYYSLDAQTQSLARHNLTQMVSVPGDDPSKVLDKYANEYRTIDPTGTPRHAIRTFLAEFIEAFNEKKFAVDEGVVIGDSVSEENVNYIFENGKWRCIHCHQLFWHDISGEPTSQPWLLHWPSGRLVIRAEVWAVCRYDDIGSSSVVGSPPTRQSAEPKQSPVKGGSRKKVRKATRK